MEIGIGLGQGADPARAAREAVRQARRAVKKPSLALVFGSIDLDQRKIHRALCEELDPRILIGGSSYAEISTAGATKRSVVALLLGLDGARVDLTCTDFKKTPFDTGLALARGLPEPAGLPLALLFASIATGHDNETIHGLRSRLARAPVFGGMCCGAYDLGMDDADFWTNYQYSGPRLTRRGARLALLDLPRGDYAASFAFEHGWQPVGPEVTLTRCDGPKVYEVEGMPVFDYYRQFVGDERDDEFFRLMIQRYGFSLPLGGGRSVMKLPVECDFKRGCITYFPAENLQGKKVRLIQASRKALVEGSRAAARRCLDALGGVPPRLIVMVSCCTRNAILHSKMDGEVSAVREVFGYDVPIFGYYSGGEIVPYESRYAASAASGSAYHTTTVALLALGSRKRPKKVSVPRCEDCPPDKAGDLRALLDKSEEILDGTEAFLANMSRKSYQDAEKLRRQGEVIYRYTPHDVYSRIGRNAARGRYELTDADFRGAFLFMDVKGFTSYSEKHGPCEVVAALNQLFEPATDAIYACGGEVDKFIGDCIFAAFKSPRNAVEAAARILTLFSRLKGTPFSVRIGINAGRAVRANVGSQSRREYTYIGDAVNLAQRLESNATPGRLLVSDQVYRAARTLLSDASRKKIQVKGKTAPIVCWDCVPA